MTVARLNPPARTSDTEVVSFVRETERAPERAFERIRRLQDEARQLAKSEIEDLCQDLEALGARCAEVASGGEAYPAGVRELAHRLASDLSDRAHSMMVLAERAAHGR